MKARRNFVLGAAIATALVAPAMVDGMAAPLTSADDNSLVAFAAARSEIAVEAASSIKVMSADFVNWIEREAASL